MKTRWDNVRGLALNIGPALSKEFRAIEDEPKNSMLTNDLTTANYNDKQRVSDKMLSLLSTPVGPSHDSYVLH